MAKESKNAKMYKIIGSVVALLVFVLIVLGQLTHWTFNFNALGDGGEQRYGYKSKCTSCSCN